MDPLYLELCDLFALLKYWAGMKPQFNDFRRATCVSVDGAQDRDLSMARAGH